MRDHQRVFVWLPSSSCLFCVVCRQEAGFPISSGNSDPLSWTVPGFICSLIQKFTAGKSLWCFSSPLCTPDTLQEDLLWKDFWNSESKLLFPYFSLFKNTLSLSFCFVLLSVPHFHFTPSSFLLSYSFLFYFNFFTFFPPFLFCPPYFVPSFIIHPSHFFFPLSSFVKFLIYSCLPCFSLHLYFLYITFLNSLSVLPVFFLISLEAESCFSFLHYFGAGTELQTVWEGFIESEGGDRPRHEVSPDPTATCCLKIKQSCFLFRPSFRVRVIHSFICFCTTSSTFFLLSLFVSSSFPSFPVFPPYLLLLCFFLPLLPSPSLCLSSSFLTWIFSFFLLLFLCIHPSCCSSSLLYESPSSPFRFPILGRWMPPCVFLPQVIRSVYMITTWIYLRVI